MEILKTADGSHTLFSEVFNEVYHSRHGSIQESNHVFIDSGLKYFIEQNNPRKPISVLEIGFGTGLNALLTMLHAEKNEVSIHYTTLEAHPVDISIVKQLNYTDLLGFEYCYGPYHTLHLCRWEEMHQVTPFFAFHKKQSKIEDVHLDTEYDIVFFDAFAPTHQPEIWSKEIFTKLYDAMSPNGILVTYCSKSIAQKAMREAGFVIEKPVGPWGKREMIRAHKRNT
ncbi:MAG: tRNA (5-methylaminomethyl-2-thiouridine)(34)-methyltransferase MnmD [Bacteroidetes bacterium]|nr:tRNA (5-methylaminomethyl-2-thiouridine)(34)-methyltransferase MnmD [Bacteroidota bacterium]